MNSAQIVKVVVKTANQLMKMKIRTRRQKRNERILLAVGLVVGVALLAGGGVGTQRVLRERKRKEDARRSSMRNAEPSNTGI